eukprot:4170917-Amphidinium_carterae.2
MLLPGETACRLSEWSSESGGTRCGCSIVEVCSSTVDGRIPGYAGLSEVSADEGGVVLMTVLLLAGGVVSSDA